MPCIDIILQIWIFILVMPYNVFAGPSTYTFDTYAGGK